MSEFFTRKDFGILGNVAHREVDEFAADIANRKLEQALGPIVYQYAPGGIHCDWSPYIDEDFGGLKKYRKQARLFQIEPIKIECSEHIPEYTNGIDSGVELVLKENKCRVCGKKNQTQLDGGR